MLETLDTIDWGSFPQPAGNASDTIPRALRQLAYAATERASSNVLFAVGNDHAGTYYPVVLRIIPFLAEILEHGTQRAKQLTLDVLIDLCASFCPEPGFATMIGVDGEAVEVPVLLDAEVRGLLPLARSLDAPPHDARTRLLARELIDTLPPGAGA